MAQINNTDLTKEIIKGAKINLSSDRVPGSIAEKVVPVMEVNPELLRKMTLVKPKVIATSGNATIFTTHADRTTYVTGITLACTKDATCDDATGEMANIFITSIEEIGGSIIIATIAGLTLTAASKAYSYTFRNPLKVDKATTIRIGGGTYTAGLKSRSAIIYGYEVED